MRIPRFLHFSELEYIKILEWSIASICGMVQRTSGNEYMLPCGLAYCTTSLVNMNGPMMHANPLVEEPTKEWIKKGSKAHSALSEIILKERWLKDVPKYLNFRSTAHLESFHNHLLMYATPSTKELRDKHVSRGDAGQEERQ
uniref:Uncharacterized protein n=1 Tax=Knipowitschia caucasica TaxID=637954 RepID=A0AAV2MCU8_KNICA